MDTNSKTILVTGGAGYIGSFMVKVLVDRGYFPVVLDDLSRSQRGKVPSDIIFYEGKVSDRELIGKILREHKFQGVIHFAGYISMEESMEKPELYFENNSVESLRLLENLNSFGVKNIIFSSTAGVYGNPERVPIMEDDRKNPTNPYGESKLIVEKMLSWFQKIHGINYAALRYFNACGALIDGSMGELHSPETHILPIALKAAKEGKEFVIYGTDYKTPDGTCVRDYIHVLDLVEAHILALEMIMEKGGGFTFNVGTGKGYSNREIVTVIEGITGRKLAVREEQRRPGDADELVADVSKIKTELGFEPKSSDIKTIVESAWKWHSQNS